MNNVAVQAKNLNSPDNIRAKLENLTRALSNLQSTSNLNRVTIEAHLVLESASVELFGALLQPLNPHIRRQAQNAIHGALWLLDCENLSINHGGADVKLF
jgi:hypothetical protein